MSRRFDDLDNKDGGFNDSEKLADAPVDDHSSTSGSSGGAPKAYFDKMVNGKRVLTEEMVDPSVLGYGWSTRKKYAILTVIATLQISLNFNTSIYPNAVTGVSETFNVSEPASRVGQLGYLIPYAFGCELWAPWSEVYGRWPILQLSLFLVNCFSLLQALAQNYAQMMVGRFLAGLSSAGGSVTLGVVADLFDADTQQYAVAYIVWSSVSGTTVGPIVGGFVQSFAPTWRWISWLQLIFNGFTMCLMWLIPETRSTILLDKEAKRRRKEAVKAGKPEPNIWGPNEVAEQRITVKEVVVTFYRPFELFLTEPIVLFCSLLSGFSDMLIFIFLESFNPVFSQYGFQPWNTGLAFVAVWIGYFIGWASFLPFIHRDNKQRAKDRYSVSPERRLYWLLWTGPLEAIGLFGFAWSSLPPDQYQTHWIAPMIFACLIGIANYCIYMATIDYMVAAYGPYSSSATGGNGFARDFLAGISAMFAAPFYHHFDTYTLAYPSTILACIAATLVAPIFLLYWKGPEIRRRSRFAQSLNEEFESTKVRKQVRDEKATGRSKHIEHSEGV